MIDVVLSWFSPPTAALLAMLALWVLSDYARWLFYRPEPPTRDWQCPICGVDFALFPDERHNLEDCPYPSGSKLG